MDLYILDDQLRRIEMVDIYESLIWTDRYKDAGDFQLTIRSDRNTRRLFTPNKRLSVSKSPHVQVVDTVEHTIDADGVDVLKVTGQSLEAWMNGRIGRDSMVSMTADPKWELTGTPGAVAREIFKHICVDGALDAGDILPFYQSGSMFPAGSIPEPTAIISVALEPDTVYNLIKRLCDLYNLGFRITREEVAGGAPSKLYFNVYTGDDRTTLQTTFPAVVFAPDLDNLSGISELSSTANYFNVAYVLGKNGTRMVYANFVDPSVAGFERKVLMVKADDIDLVAGTPLQNALEQRGQEELAKYRTIIAFDGEIPQFNSYEYLVDYDLGDLVETRSEDGISTNMRVTEQIFVADREGERSYPTLAIDLLITPGSWLAWESGEEWIDADGYWADA